MGDIHEAVERGVLVGRYGEELRSILKSFLPFFDVTFGHTGEFRRSKVTAFLIKPDRHFKDAFAVEREVLMIHCHYASVEERIVLIAADLLELDPIKGRAETAFVVIVCPAVGLMEAARRWGSESRQVVHVVPFQEKECINPPDQGFHLLRRFQEYLFKYDFFDVSNPIREDSYFFGRTTLLMEIRAAMKSGENVGLFGLRKTGKTSTIYQLARSIEQERDSTLVYLDLQDPDLHQKRWWELLDVIRHRINELRGEKKGLEGSAAKSSALFRKAVAAVAKGRQIVIALDEIEHIAPGVSAAEHWKDDFLTFWQTARAVQAENRHIAFLVCGVNATVIETPSYGGKDNPLFSMAKVRYMPPMQVEEIGRMLKRLGMLTGLIFDESAISYLAGQYGGHPFLTRQACSYFHRTLPDAVVRPKTISQSDLLLQEEERERELIPRVRQVTDMLKQWYPDEYDMVGMLCDGEVDDFKGLADENPQYVNHLIKYGMLAVKPYRVTIPMLRLAMQKGGRKRGGEIDPKRLSDISYVVALLEPKLRHFIRRQLKSRYGSKWFQRLLEAIPEEKRAAFAGVAADEALETKFLFSDLVSCILHRWDTCFHHLQEEEQSNRVTKDQFKMLLDSVNAARLAAAHPRPFSDPAMAAFQACVAQIDRILSKHLAD